MVEFIFFIRKQKNSKDNLPRDVHHQFLKSCESYIDNLKSKNQLISAQPIDWRGKIISNKNQSWNESSFDESDEVIGGYYHILANSLEEAVEIAKRNPEFAYTDTARIEVRPIKMKEQSTGFIYPETSR